MANSVYKKLDKVRKPRVQIRFDAESGESTEKKELPFVMGVMGDYSGDSEESTKSLKDRKFVEIDGDNFDKVMSKINPELKLKVANKLSEDDQEMAVDLKFKSMDDFEPDNIAQQVPALKKLMDTRAELLDLVAKADRSEDLEGILEDVLQNNKALKELSKALGAEADSVNQKGE